MYVASFTSAASFVDLKYEWVVSVKVTIQFLFVIFKWNGWRQLNEDTDVFPQRPHVRLIKDSFQSDLKAKEGEGNVRALCLTISRGLF